MKAGSATISQTLGTTTVRQLTDRAIIDWRKFSVSPSEAVRFVQPSEMAVILNRVVGGDPSLILGKLQANGQLFLVNPNGILFGPDSRVDVGSLVATTLSISNQDFLSGNYQFSQDPSFNLASVINQGQIRVSDEGYVILTAPLVSNEGLIVANLGKVTLTTGQQLTLNLDGRELVSYQIGGAPGEDGTVVLTPEAVSNVLGQVVSTGGLQAAGQLVEENGEVRLVGGQGLLVQAGTIQAGEVSLEAGGAAVATEASATVAPGGAIRVLGEHVHVAGRLDASSPSGGGTVLLGGNVRGAGPERNALTTTVAGSAKVTADGLEAGDGGTIVVWSDELTEVAGSLSARGGSNGGDGGLIETSSRETLVFTGQVDASSAAGSGGDWLIDPANLTIVSSLTGANQILNSTISSTLSAGTSVRIDAQSASGNENVSLNAPGYTPSAAGNITQLAGASVVKSGGGDATLTLHAGEANGAITLNDTITATSGALDVVLEAGSSSRGKVTVNGAITTNGGDFLSSGGGAYASSNAAPILAGTGDVTIMHTGSVSVGSLQGQAVQIQSLAGNVNEANTADASVDITADTLTINSATGIGSSNAIEIEAAQLAANTTGTGNIALVDGSSGLHVLSANAANGAVTVSTTGNLLVDLAYAHGTGKNVALNTLGSGDVELGQAISQLGSVLITSAGSIESTLSDGIGDVIALNGSVTLKSQTGIGNGAPVDLETGTVTLATAAVTGGINLLDFGGLTVTKATTADGDITLVTDGGNLTATSVVAGGTSQASLSSLNAGNVMLGSVSASGISISAQGAIEEIGSGDTTADLIGSTLVLQAQSGIGAAGAVEVHAPQIASVTTASGDLNLANLSTGDVVVEMASGGGSVSLSSAGALRAVEVAALGNVALSGKSSLEIGSVIAGGDISAVSGGAVRGSELISGPEIVGHNASVTAGGEVELDVALTGSLTAKTTKPGSLIVSSAESLTVASAVTSDGSIELTSEQSLQALTVTAGGTGKNVDLIADGEVSVANVSAASDRIRVVAGGSILETGLDDAADLTATTLELTAYEGIGGPGASELEVAATHLTATAGASLFVRDTAGGLDVHSAAAGGDVSLGATAGNLTARNVLAGSENLARLATTTSGNVLIDEILAGAIEIDSAGTVTELTTSLDEEVDLTATAITITARSGIGSASNPLRAEAESATLNVPQAGGIYFDDASGGLDLHAATLSGAITASTTGGDLIAYVDAQGNATLTSLTDDILVSFVGANGLARLEAPNGEIREQIVGSGEPDLMAGTLSLSSLCGIDLDVEVGGTVSLAQVLGTGDLDLESPFSSLQVTSASAADGNIRLASPEWSLTVTSATSAEGNIALSAGNDVSLGSVKALGESGTVSVESELGILELGNDAGADIEAETVSLIAAGNIGSAGAIELAASMLQVLANEARLADLGGGLQVLSSDTVDLALSTTGGDLLVDTAVSAFDLKLTASGSVELTDAWAGGLATVTSTGGSITGELYAGSAVLQAATGVGLGGDMGNITASVTDDGGIHIAQYGGMSVTATTMNGEIALSTEAGDILAQSVKAGGTGDVTLTIVSDYGSIGLGLVSASGDEVTLGAGPDGGMLYELGNDSEPDLIASTARLVGPDGIGALANPLEMSVPTLTLAQADLSGSIGLSNTGSLNVMSASSAEGIQLSSSGAMTVHSLSAGADVSLTTTSGNVNLESVVSSGNVSVLTPGSLTELGSDAEPEIVGSALALTTGTGIGTVGALGNELEIAAEVLTASAGVSGAIAVSDPDILNVVAATTGNGVINLTAGGSLTVQAASAGGSGRNLSLTSTGGTVLLGDVSALDDQVLVTAYGSIGSADFDPNEADLTAASTTLIAGDAISLEVAVDTLSRAEVSGSGGVVVQDVSGGLQVGEVVVPEGSIGIGTGGGDLVAPQLHVAAGHSVTLTTADSGDVLLDSISASHIVVDSAGKIEELSVDEATELTAVNIDLIARQGIGSQDALELVVTSTSGGNRVDAHNLGDGDVSLHNDALGDTFYHLDTHDGDIVLEQPEFSSLLTASTQDGSISATGAGLHVGDVVAGGSGDILIHTIPGWPWGETIIFSAVAEGNTINVIAEGGRIYGGGAYGQTTPELVADVVNLHSHHGIGIFRTMMIDAGTVSATNDIGPLLIENVAGDLTVPTLVNGVGDVGVFSHGDLVIPTASTTGADLNLSAAGDIRFDSVSTTNVAILEAGGRIEDLAPDLEVDVTGTYVKMSAHGGIDPLQLQVDGGSLNVNVTGAGDINLTEVDGLSSFNAFTEDGDISLTVELGGMGVGLGQEVGYGQGVVAGGDGEITLTTLGDSGMIHIVGLVSAEGNTVTITSTAERINGQPGTGLVSADVINLTAEKGIGSQGPVLEVDSGSSLTATVTGNGWPLSLTEVAGDLTGVVSNPGGEISLTALDRDIFVTSSSGSSLTLTSGGSVQVANLASAPTHYDISADGAVQVLQTGSHDMFLFLQADVTTVHATVEGAGKIHIDKIEGSLHVQEAVTDDGPITIATQDGALTIDHISASGGLVSLSSHNGDLGFDSVEGDGISVYAFGDVYELNPDPDPDLVAESEPMSVLYSKFGTIGIEDALEVSITNSQLGVYGGAAVAGVSVRIDGFVSPTNTLIVLGGDLGPVPGSVLFNGAQIYP